MSRFVVDLREIEDHEAAQAGGKALALARLLRQGFSVPPGLCILADAYRSFVDTTSLAERIRLELGRKEFRDLRWEELWDSSLRIRNLFSRTPFPAPLEEELAAAVGAKLGQGAAAVRSSAIGEDSRELSFAGLHESVLNVIGTESILEQVKRVWASLWSDAALLYRQELGLEVERSAMAVVVQRFTAGECSGVIFSQSPLDPEVAVLEAVSGLAKGLVDGEVDPERWEIERGTGRVRSRRLSAERRRVVAGVGGVRVVADERAEGAALLTEAQAAELYAAARRAETLFGGPQDVEWTFGPEGLQLLQSRPVTAKKQDPQEKRAWNLSLRRSFENLSALRHKIEGSILPDMKGQASALAQTDLGELDDEQLAGEIERRQAAADHWTGVYWQELIPFAHGMRLFGQVYNDAVRPQDPFAFVALLRPDRLQSIERNRLLRGMAEYIRGRPELRERLQEGELARCGDAELLAQLEAYQQRYGAFLGFQEDRRRLEEQLKALLLEMSDPALPLNAEAGVPDQAELEREFLASFQEDDRQQARELLELGRASYRIRDDDNIYLDRFRELLLEAEAWGRDRLTRRGVEKTGEITGPELVRSLSDAAYRPHRAPAPAAEDKPREVAARQLLGQPASHGIAAGPARVVLRPEDLFAIRRGEILVCDAIDPAMTFVAPLAAGIVERRGGMLIHGAIIAREYGIPCVTGIPEATERIATGDRVTVDGYLGIVVIDASNRGDPAGLPFRNDAWSGIGCC
ncbi:MAG: hypothetical protein JW820_08515 [Spirochaetales bacterium]|nr:hypothetical protein [Spirochaetales bacterium]